MHFLYVLYNLDEKSERKFYIGISSNLDRRISEHVNKLSGYTKRFGSWRLIYYEAYNSLFDAELREKQLKHHGKGFSELKKRFAKSIDEIKKVRDN